MKDCQCFCLDCICPWNVDKSQVEFVFVPGSDLKDYLLSNSIFIEDFVNPIG